MPRVRPAPPHRATGGSAYGPDADWAGARGAGAVLVGARVLGG